MDFQYLLSTANIGQTYSDLAIKTTWPQQRGIKYVRAVCCRNDNNAIVSTKTVHFHQELVEGLLSLVMTAA